MTVLLHGFWGQPSDWNQVMQALPINIPILAADLYEDSLLAPHTPLGKWPLHFWRWVSENAGEEPIDLVGYSMGARMAVAATCAQPQRVRRALFLSGNPCIPAGADREAWETQWTQDFLNKPWPELEAAWQDQPVFNGSLPCPRRQTPQLREQLGLSLRLWSPRLQTFTNDSLRALPNSMSWAFGALDQKYLEVVKALQELPVQGQINVIPNAGHRLISDAADFVSQWIQTREI